MAKEKFAIVAFEETSNWELPPGIEAAFGVYLVRVGEATHVCSFTPSSYAVFLQNEFVYDCDDEAAHEWAGDNLNENGGESGTYFSYQDFDKIDPRRVCETFNVSVDARTMGGLRSDRYHAAIWREAEDEARDMGCNGAFGRADILNLATYLWVEEERAAKRRAENRPPLAGNDQLPLFVVAAQRMGIDTYAKAAAMGWL